MAELARAALAITASTMTKPYVRAATARELTADLVKIDIGSVLASYVPPCGWHNEGISDPWFVSDVAEQAAAISPPGYSVNPTRL